LFANYFEADVDFGFGEMAASSYRGQSAVLKRKAVGRSASFSKGAKIAVPGSGYRTAIMGKSGRFASQQPLNFSVLKNY
jgi:hypothetical protein